MGYSGCSFMDAGLPDSFLFGSTSNLKLEAVSSSEKPLGLKMMTDYAQDVYSKRFDTKDTAIMENGWNMQSDGWNSKGTPVDIDGDACYLFFKDCQGLYGGDVRYLVVLYDKRHTDNGDSERFIIDVMFYRDGQTIYDKAVSCSLRNGGQDEKEAHMSLLKKTGIITKRIMDALPESVNPKGL